MNAIALALLSLLLVAATPSGDPRTNEHQKATDKQPNTIQQQQVETGAEIERLAITIRDAEIRLLEAVTGIRKQAEADTKQRHADAISWNSPSVWINGGLLVVGVFYTIFACLQWRAIRKQARIANQTLDLQHRPLLHVRNVTPQPRILSTIDSFNVFLTVVNRGGSPATLVDQNITVWLDINPDIPISETDITFSGIPYDESTESAAGVRSTVKDDRLLQPGVPYKFVKPQKVPDLHIQGRWHSGKLYLYVLGYFRFVDQLGLTHETAFCRRYNRTKFLFEIVDNPDYEHQE